MSALRHDRTSAASWFIRKMAQEEIVAEPDRQVQRERPRNVPMKRFRVDQVSASLTCLCKKNTRWKCMADRKKTVYASRRSVEM
jgi:hypothetical protein